MSHDEGVIEWHVLLLLLLLLLHHLLSNLDKSILIRMIFYLKMRMKGNARLQIASVDDILESMGLLSLEGNYYRYNEW